MSARKQQEQEQGATFPNQYEEREMAQTPMMETRQEIFRVSVPSRTVYTEAWITT